jgi:hypothetical protein
MMESQRGKLSRFENSRNVETTRLAFAVAPNCSAAIFGNSSGLPSRGPT